MQDLVDHCKDGVSLAPKRIDDRGASVFEIIQERDNDALGQGGSGRKGEKSLGSRYILKTEMTDVADGSRCKTKEESRLTPWSKQKEEERGEKR